MVKNKLKKIIEAGTVVQASRGLRYGNQKAWKECCLQKHAKAGTEGEII